MPAECGLLRSAGKTEPHVNRDLAAAVLMSTFLVAGCGGAQSALEPAGRDAEWIADLFVWLTVGFVVVWLCPKHRIFPLTRKHQMRATLVKTSSTRRNAIGANGQRSP